MRKEFSHFLKRIMCFQRTFDVTREMLENKKSVCVAMVWTQLQKLALMERKRERRTICIAHGASR